jgi:hypothetical protein
MWIFFGETKNQGSITKNGNQSILPCNSAISSTFGLKTQIASRYFQNSDGLFVPKIRI